jgi:DNA-directed RNA polymerase II subunit RPB1
MDTEIYTFDEKIRPIDRIEFNILGNEEIQKMSALGPDSVGIDIPDLYENMEPKRGGLIDTRMGVTDNHLDCKTCGLNTLYCIGHPAHILLADPVFHIGYIQHIKKILSCICLKCSRC